MGFACNSAVGFQAKKFGRYGGGAGKLQGQPEKGFWGFRLRLLGMKRCLRALSFFLRARLRSGWRRMRFSGCLGCGCAGLCLFHPTGCLGSLKIPCLGKRRNLLTGVVQAVKRFGFKNAYRQLSWIVISLIGLLRWFLRGPGTNQPCGRTDF